jgi:arylsulfatase A-like enzyme
MGDRLTVLKARFALSMFAALLSGLLNCNSGETPEIAPIPPALEIDSSKHEPDIAPAPSTPNTALASSTLNTAPTPSMPNIVLIIIDTLRADLLGAYGYPLPTSPEIDAFGREGVRFARVVAPSTWTRPSHGALLTSLHPRTLGLYKEQREILANRFVTLAETLQKHGYFSVGATANPNINSTFNFHQGFDVYVDTSVVLEWMSPGPDERVLDRDGYRLPVMAEVFDAILDELRNRADTPYYVQANLMEIHEAGSGCEGGEGGAARADPAYRDLFPEVRECLRRGYLQAIRAVSHSVDQFVRTLSSMPGGDETLFVITSDHGETLPGDHPGLGKPTWHGWLVYESQVLVPWILYSPGGALPRGVVIDRPVRLLDLMPTLLDYAGVDGPAEMEGRSLMPLVRGTEKSVGLPDHFVVETQMRRADKIAVYSSSWKYIENHDRHAGTRARELHPMGRMENGSATDVSRSNRDVTALLSEHLRDWQSTHPRAEATLRDEAVPDSVVKQLRAIGYLE